MPRVAHVRLSSARQNGQKHAATISANHRITSHVDVQGEAGESRVTALTHPAFIRAANLSEPLKSHFPKSSQEAADWVPMIRYRALAMRVLAVARTRVECAWAAYVDAVPGMNHLNELMDVLDRGDKLDEFVARLLFPEFDDVPYAE